MPKYFYQAKTLNGEPKAGSKEAKNERELARILRQEGCLLISASLGKTRKALRLPFSIPFLDRVSLTSKLMFTRNLRVLVSAGVSLPRSLKILSDQSKSKSLSKILLKIREEIIRGKSFSEALKEYENVFSELFVSMIRVGEETGTMENVLEVLGRQMEKDHQLRSKIKGAMVYPAVIIVAMAGIGTLMLIIVVPKLSEVFEEMGAELPLTTRAIIKFGNLLAEFWYTLPVIVIGVIFLFRFLLKTKIGKRTYDTIVLKIPIINTIVIKTNSAYTIRTLSSLIAAGVPIVRSLEIVSNSLTNVHYKKAIAETAEKVRKGAKLGESLEAYRNIYPDLVIQMMQVGEETGETSEILKKLSDFFEEEVTNATKNLSAVIEPFLMLLIGGAVAFFAISMIQPIYGLMQTL